MNVRNPKHHYLYCSTPPVRIAVLLVVPLRSGERELLSVLLPFVSQYASHAFVLQYASHLCRSTFGKILVVVVTGIFPK